MTLSPLQGPMTGPKSELLRGTLVLEHAYELGRRLGANSLATTYEAVQRPFTRAVHVRLYDRLEDLGLPDEARTRLKRLIESGGEGGLATDYGELDNGTPFLVLEAPRGEPLADWWRARARSPAALAAVGLAACALADALSAQRRLELVLEQVFAETADDGPTLRLQAIGDAPSRAEVRDMTGLLQRDRVAVFPPECFRPPTAEADDLERAPAADTYRVAALLYQLWTGEHPYFPADRDVAASVAELVNEVGQRPRPLASGSAALDELVASGLSLEAGGRPSWDDFRAALAALVAKRPPAAPPAESARERRPAQPAGRLPRPLAWAIQLILLASVALATYLISHRPPEHAAVILTSEPAGVLFEEVDGRGEARPLGRTPILLPDRPLLEPLSIRPVYEDGQRGSVQTLRPEQLEDVEACRTLQIRWQAPSTSQPAP